jgi:hypothetical protein
VKPEVPRLEGISNVFIRISLLNTEFHTRTRNW